MLLMGSNTAEIKEFLYYIIKYTFYIFILVNAIRIDHSYLYCNSNNNNKNNKIIVIIIIIIIIKIVIIIKVIIIYWKFNIIT